MDADRERAIQQRLSRLEDYTADWPSHTELGEDVRYLLAQLEALRAEHGRLHEEKDELVKVAARHWDNADVLRAQLTAAHEALGPRSDLSTALAEALHKARTHAGGHEVVTAITGAFDALRAARLLAARQEEQP